MKIMNNKRLKSLLLCMMLIVAMAFTMIGCNTKKESDSQDAVSAVQETQESTAEEQETEASAAEVLGEGETKFLFTVVDNGGKETNFEIHTDREIVGEALLDLDLIAGDEGEFGLYVKTVNGITADYDVDQTYWAFYIDGEYAMSGVDATNIEEGKTYTFKVEK